MNRNDLAKEINKTRNYFMKKMILTFVVLAAFSSLLMAQKEMTVDKNFFTIGAHL